MLRTTIMLPEKLKIRAIQLARQQGVSLSEFIREALNNSCSIQNLTERDAFFADNVAYDGKVPQNISSHHDL